MQNNFIAIDFETATPQHDTPCALGITIVENGKITLSKEYLINPECPINPYNSHIHGITDEDVEESPTFKKVWGEIEHFFIKTPIIVAHNIIFDRSVLRKVSEKYGIKLPAFTYYCTLETVKLNYPKLPSFKLPYLCEIFGISLNNHHNSLEDSKACAKLMLFLKQSAQVHESTYAPKTRRTGRSDDLKELSIPKIEYDAPFFIEFNRKRFAVTGTILGYNRNEIEHEILIRGGTIGNVIPETDYLIVGYTSGLHSKIKRAEELKANRSKIQIIYYEDFLPYFECTDPIDILEVTSELELQRLLGLITPSADSCKQLYYYSGSQCKIPTHCRLLRVDSIYPMVVCIEVSGSERKIALDYLKEMQPTKEQAKEFDKIIMSGLVTESVNKDENCIKISEEEILLIVSKAIDEAFLQASSIKYADKKDRHGNIREAFSFEYKSIVISAQPTPYRQASESEPLLCRVKTGKETQYISFAPQHSKILRKYGIPYTTIVSDVFLRIELSEFLNIVSQDHFKKAINEIFVSAFNFDAFGCCSRYKECSAAEHCLHDDIIYASAACQYKRHLDAGEIFYK